MNSLHIALTLMALPLLALLLFMLLKSIEGLYVRVSIIISAAVTLLSGLLFSKHFGGSEQIQKFLWFELGGNKINFILNLDFITATMLFTVSIVAFLVQWYSIAYMKNEDGIKRYYAWLNLFQFAMFGIVLSGNLLQTFFFWELVGFASWLLIGFWYKKKAASNAAQKAFIINRIGDAGFILSLIIVWSSMGTFDLDIIKETLSKTETVAGAWIIPVSAGEYLSFVIFDSSIFFLLGLGLFLAVAGKSAQFPLQTWLPDAMEGPTPVSALIHAATMVAAGVYLLLRVYFLFSPDILNLIAIAGGLTAFMGAFAAFGQFDLKRILAYSTISQLGYMVMAIGVGAWNAAFFHLITHAFFKAGLFLIAGNIIHSLSHSKAFENLDPQDIRNMGGLRKLVPFSHFAFIICAAALMGIPGFSGFLSKEAILSGSLAWANYALSWKGIVPLLGFISMILTVLYMSRLYRFVFMGNFRYDAAEIHEGSRSMKWPVILLAMLSIGAVFNPGFDPSMAWLMKNMSYAVVYLKAFPRELYPDYLAALAHEKHFAVSMFSILLLVLSVLLSIVLYKNIDRQKGNKGYWMNLAQNNWYLDRIQQVLVLNPTLKMANMAFWVDKNIIDRIVDSIGVMGVVIAHFVNFIDRFVVDGMVNFFAPISMRIGNITRSFNNASIQGFVIAGAGLFLIFIFWLAKHLI
jgi:NADH-quinone oxidoreductase subunit L